MGGDSVSGSPPNQHLVWNQTSLAAGVSTHVHVVSSTSAATCGAALSNTASFTSANGGSGSASASVQVLGPPTTAMSQNFDGVTAPALPAGWTASNDQGSGPWTTSSSGNPSPPADSAPNAAFVNDPATVSDKRLDSPTIAVPGGLPVLTFRQNRNLESTYDGGVLEISIDGGPFQDIIASGGTFVGGGYNATISTTFTNPLAGRSAWSGSSNGFLTTTVNLPPAAAGHNVVLRWRMGSDESVADRFLFGHSAPSPVPVRRGRTASHAVSA